MSIQNLLAKIAKGPKASKDLTWDECKQAMKALIEGEATPVQVGAFLIAMRFKMESVAELAALTSLRIQCALSHCLAGLGLVDVPTYARKAGHVSCDYCRVYCRVAAGAAVLMQL